MPGISCRQWVLPAMYSARGSSPWLLRGRDQTPAFAVPSPPPSPSPAASAPRAVLDLVVGGRTALRFPLAGDRPTTLGRSSDADIPLGDRLVSRMHAGVRLEDSGWTIRDLGSRNGTTVDGRTVGSAPLRPGVLIGIGTFNLVFHIAAADAPPADIPPAWRLVRCATAEQLAGEALARHTAPAEQGAKSLARHLAATRLLGCGNAAETAAAVVELAMAHCALAAAAWLGADRAAGPVAAAPPDDALAAPSSAGWAATCADGGLAIWLTPADEGAADGPRGDLVCIPVGPAPGPLVVARSTDSPLRAADLEFLALVASLAAARAGPSTAGHVAGAVAAAGDLAIATWERALIAEALRRHAGNVIAAARELGMSRATLYRRLGRSSGA